MSEKSCPSCGWNNGEDCQEPGFPGRDLDDYLNSDDCPGWKPRDEKTWRNRYQVGSDGEIE